MKDLRNIQEYEFWNRGDYVGKGTIYQIAEMIGKSPTQTMNIIRHCDRTPDTKVWKVTRIPLDIPRVQITNTHSRLKAIIGDNIRRLREEAEFTQQELADEIGMDQSNLSNIELGFTGSLQTAARFIDFFKIDPVILFEDWLDQDEKDGFYEL